MPALMGSGTPGSRVALGGGSSAHLSRLDPFPPTLCSVPEPLRVWWWQVGQRRPVRGRAAVNERSSVAWGDYGAERGSGPSAAALQSGDLELGRKLPVEELENSLSLPDV